MEPQENKEVTLTLPLDTINACLAALSKFPYEVAQPHIDLVRSRAAEGLAPTGQEPTVN